ncbi:hypothetical protein IW138_006036 [Coemansia sp. RSA 986]|nr:hypothetical protein LPJ74_006453 [Coemansia sp. RSA 1843]KAJ2085900.1 hypothetical protein IW138_006036 [Coemansia sp. RSA 986]
MSPIAVDSNYHDEQQGSPFYTDDCDLYPQRMREVMNQRDTTVVQTGRQRSESTATATDMDIQSILELYPGLARLVQQQQQQ